MEMNTIKTILFGLVALVFTVNGIQYALVANFDFGYYVVWCIAILSFVYALLHKRIDAVTASGFGFGCKVVFLAGCALFAVILCIIIAGQFTNKPSGDEEIMIVLGGGINGDEPGIALKYRLDEAYDYYLEHPDLTIVVAGGTGVAALEAEATVMQRYLVNKGVPEEQILVEDQSTSTDQNFRLSKVLLEENGFDITEDTPIIYVTNGFHCMRAGQYAKDAGFTNASALAAGLPASQILICYMREVFAVVYYAVFKSPDAGFLKNYVGLLAIFGKG